MLNCKHTFTNSARRAIEVAIDLLDMMAALPLPVSTDLTRTECSAHCHVSYSVPRVVVDHVASLADSLTFRGFESASSDVACCASHIACCSLLQLVASCCALHQNITTLADEPAFRDFEKASSELQRVNFTGLSRQVLRVSRLRTVTPEPLISRRSLRPAMDACCNGRVLCACVLCAVAHT